MTAVPLLQGWQDWECPACHYTERVSPPLPAHAQRWHPCRALHMLKTPLVPAGTDCKIEAIERQDYLGAEIQRTGDDGKPYAAIRTERADGSNDLAVYAPLAHATIRDLL
jgi:hypothetical protein